MFSSSRSWSLVLWITLVLALLLGGVLATILWLNAYRDSISHYLPPRDKDVTRHAGAVPPSVRFVDITEQAGIRFRHINGAFGRKLLPETMGSGSPAYPADVPTERALPRVVPFFGILGGAVDRRPTLTGSLRARHIFANRRTRYRGDRAGASGFEVCQALILSQVVEN